MSAPRWVRRSAGKNASSLGGKISVDDPERSRDLFKTDRATGCAVPDHLRCTYMRPPKTSGSTDLGGRCGTARFRTADHCGRHLSPEERLAIQRALYRVIAEMLPTMSQCRIALALGLSPARVSQLRRKGEAGGYDSPPAPRQKKPPA